MDSKRYEIDGAPGLPSSLELVVELRGVGLPLTVALRSEGNDLRYAQGSSFISKASQFTPSLSSKLRRLRTGAQSQQVLFGLFDIAAHIPETGAVALEVLLSKLHSRVHLRKDVDDVAVSVGVDGAHGRPLAQQVGRVHGFVRLTIEDFAQVLENYLLYFLTQSSLLSLCALFPSALSQMCFGMGHALLVYT